MSAADGEPVTGVVGAVVAWVTTSGCTVTGATVTGATVVVVATPVPPGPTVAI